MVAYAGEWVVEGRAFGWYVDLARVASWARLWSVSARVGTSMGSRWSEEVEG